MTPRTLLLKVRALLARKRVEEELDEELRFHLEMETEANLRRGLPPSEARRVAYAEFGGVERFKEGARDARGTRWIEDLTRDVRHGFRSLGRAPAFAAAALATIGLAVGGTTAVFSVVRGVLLRPLPFAEPDRLVTVWMNNPPQGIDEDIASYPNFADWREQIGALEHVVGVRGVNVNLTGAGDPEELRGAQVTRGFFEMLGIPPALGRGFLPEEAEGGTPSPLVVLSHELWTRRYGGDPSVLGNTIQLNDLSHQVVGVMPAGFGYTAEAQLWTPLTFTGPLGGLEEPRGALWLPVVGRLARGATLEEAQVEASAIGARLAEAYPNMNEGTSIKLEPLHETLVGDVRTPLLTLLGAVTLVLLIGVANVANLLLARGAGRAREMAVRLSLGAGKGRLVRQVLAESAALGAAGAALGCGLAALGVRLLIHNGPTDLPRLETVSVDLPVLAFALALSFGASLLFGLMPALQAGRAGAAGDLRQGARGASDGRLHRLRNAFVVAQFALALVLLVGSGLLARSFVNLLRVDAGFEPRAALTFRVGLPGGRYPSGPEVVAFYARLTSELESLPGVEGAAVVANVFLSRLPNMARITVERRPELDTREHPVPYDGVTDGFVEALGMRLVSGRSFAPADDREAPLVAVASETFVRTFLPDREPLGARFLFGNPSGNDPPWITIVGVVRDAKRAGLDQRVRPYVFLPMAQAPSWRADVVVRASGDPLALSTAVREAVGRLDADLPLSNLRTLEQAVSGSLAQRRFLMFLVAVFAAAATLLAGVGIYGVMAYLVGRRTREIGIQVALGASRGTVIGSVLGQSLVQAGGGVVVGMLGAVAVTRFLRGQLFGLEPTDPATFAAMAALLVAVALVASWLPAWRAARVEPSVALREE
jgi:putative ABC transport system permease protein